MDRSPENYVALDTEWLHTSLGIQPKQIVILDYEGNVLLNEYIKPIDEIKGSSKYINRPEAKEYSLVKPRVMELLKGKIIIGHDLAGDLKVLQLPLDQYEVIDTAFIPELLDYHITPKKLKHLAKQLLGRVIQPTFTNHNAQEDALAALNIVKMYKNNITIDPKPMSKTKLVKPYTYPTPKFKRAKMNTPRNTTRNIKNNSKSVENIGLPKARKTRRSRKH